MSNFNKVFGSPLQAAEVLPEVVVGQEVSLCCGSDRNPGKIVEIIKTKAGKTKGYMVQRYDWIQNNSGYAQEILWDKPYGSPQLYPVALSGRNKGKPKDLSLSGARPFFDMSF